VIPPPGRTTSSPALWKALKPDVSVTEFPTMALTMAFSATGEPTLSASPGTMFVPLPRVMTVSPGSDAFASVVVMVVAATASTGMTVQ
jgi:hypothetical protein